MKISTVLDKIDSGTIALPEFQRSYVWSRRQVRDLVESLYRGFPVGSLLLWETATESADARGEGQLQRGYVWLLLDGQQRMSSLYGLIRGSPPPFFDGNAQAFSDLRFNVDTERFRFYAPVNMRDDPRRASAKAFVALLRLTAEGGAPWVLHSVAWDARMLNLLCDGPGTIGDFVERAGKGLLGAGGCGGRAQAGSDSGQRKRAPGGWSSSTARPRPGAAPLRPR